MNPGERRWEIMEDTDFIGSQIDDSAELGFYEFTDGVLLVASVTEDCSGDGMEVQPTSGLVDGYFASDLDDIPF